MKRQRILLIDDEEDFHDILRQILEPAGYELTGATDGDSGIRLMRRRRPDLLILDVNMPLKDGNAVCREVRADPQFADLPILMLTIRRLDAEIVTGLESGADDYLVKPFKPRELQSRVRNLLRRS